VTDNNRLIDYSHSQAYVRILARDSKKQSGSARTTFMSRLANAEDKISGMRPSLGDLGNECLNMINAGADPFSSVLAGAFFYLANNLEALRQATGEVRYVCSLCNHDQLLTYTQLNIQFAIRNHKRQPAQLLHLPICLHRRNFASHCPSTQSPSTCRSLRWHDHRRPTLPRSHRCRRAHVCHPS
jgi:hypothetical protein